MLKNKRKIKKILNLQKKKIQEHSRHKLRLNIDLEYLGKYLRIKNAFYNNKLVITNYLGIKYLTCGFLTNKLHQLKFVKPR